MNKRIKTDHNNIRSQCASIQEVLEIARCHLRSRISQRYVNAERRSRGEEGSDVYSQLGHQDHMLLAACLVRLVMNLELLKAAGYHSSTLHMYVMLPPLLCFCIPSLFHINLPLSYLYFMFLIYLYHQEFNWKLLLIHNPLEWVDNLPPQDVLSFASCSSAMFALLSHAISKPP